MIWYQNSVCTITFLHLDSQVIIIKPFSHFFIPGACLNAWDFWGFFFLFFVFFVFFEVGLCSTFFLHLVLKLTLLSTFIFSEFFHFWVRAFYFMLDFCFVQAPEFGRQLCKYSIKIPLDMSLAPFRLINDLKIFA